MAVAKSPAFRPHPMSRLRPRNFCIPMVANLDFDAAAKRIGARPSKGFLKAGPGKHRSFVIALNTGRVAMFSEWEMYRGATEIQIECDRAGRVWEEDFLIALSALNIARKEVSLLSSPHKWIPARKVHAG
jgi:hypothetical protein